MVRSHLLVAGVAAGSLALSFAAASCGGTDTTSGTTGGAVDLSHPPAVGEGAKAPDGAGDVTFALRKLYLGDTNPDGTPNKVNGWKQYGYDLDGKASTADSTDLCKPRNNTAPKNVYPDGDKGIDNSFGKNILSIILGIAGDAPTKVNQGIADGSFTIMLNMKSLGTGTDYKEMLTKLYGGSKLAAAPKFDGSDMWPVIPELLTNESDVTSAKVQFPQSYLVGNTWVSGSKGDVGLNLSVAGFTLSLTIASAVLTMQLDAGHKNATHGIIAGVLPTDVLTGELKKVAGAFDQSLCSGATINSFVSQIESASDIMADGTQDPTKPCDGISIGLGFDAAVVQLGGIGPKAAMKTDPCAASGGGGSGGTGSTGSSSSGSSSSGSSSSGSSGSGGSGGK